MTNFTKTIIKFIFLFSLAYTTMSYANETTNQTCASKPAPTSYLFIQTADSGTLQANPAKLGDYTLTLKKISPFVIYFSDEPKRVSGLMPLEKFLDLWNSKNSGFAKSLPNVGVNAFKMHSMFNRKDVDFVIVPKDPKYNAANNTITYKVTILPGDIKALPLTTLKFSNIALFFDNFMAPCPSCCYTC